MALRIEGPTPRRPRAAGQHMLIRDEAADAYVRRLVAGVRAARLNSFFSPTELLVQHLGFLGPTGSDGLHPSVRISTVNALPMPSEILRVKVDRELAAEFLSRTAGPIPTPGTRLDRKRRYYQRLLGVEVMPASRMTVELRQQLPAEGLGLFRVLLDRFDLACNQFVRYTILLGQRDGRWRKAKVRIDADLEAPTEAFRRVVDRLAAHEAEVAFILLSELAGIEVEDVRRCRVGPLLLPGARVGGPLEALLDPEVGPCAGTPHPPWILCFPEDRAGIEVAEHSGQDPLAPLMREAVGEASRALVDAKAENLGYRVAKSRKFVCPPPLVRPLEELCRSLGAPSIVRSEPRGGEGVGEGGLPRVLGGGAAEGANGRSSAQGEPREGRTGASCAREEP